MFNLHRKLLGEVPMTYNGGGKSGGNQTQTPAPINTTTAIGNQLDAVADTADTADISKEKAVDKKKMGTRGLQIPLQSTKSETASSPTAPTTGIQI